jgi:hypothetical protein
VSPLLVIVPIWLVALWVVTGLCVAARLGDHVRPLAEEAHPVGDIQQEAEPAQPEWAGEQWQPQAPAVLAEREAA